MHPIRPASLLLSCALLAACADRTPVSPAPGSPAGPTSPPAQKVECVARVREQTVTCGAAGVPAAARGNIYGGQGQNVKLTTTSVSWDAGTGTFGGTVTVQNLLPYALGVHEGMEADSAGVKVFFVSGPTATAGSGTVTVQNADGTGVLTAAGQPFFKYAQVLDPQQVSAEKSWLFHLDPGVTAFAFAVYVSAAQQPSAFRIVAPRANDTIPPDSVTVEVIGNAPPATTSVRAQLGRVQSFLEYAGNNRWKGQISTVDIDSRMLNPLTIVAVSPLDSLVQKVGLFNPNHGPVLRLTAPLLGFVARDTTAVRVAGTCVTAGTDNPCTVTARVGSGPDVSVTGPSFDFTVAAPHSDLLRVTARDTHGGSFSDERMLIVETSPLLQEVASAGSQVWAGNADFLLYSGDSLDARVRPLRLRDRATGAEVTLRADIGGRDIEHVSFTPTCVVFGITGFGADSLMEYRSGVLSHLGNGYSVQVEGGWMVWATVDSTLYLRDLVAGSTTPIATKAAWPYVAANGDVVFEQQGVVKRYRAGVVTPIGPGEAPKTDGNLVVYTSPWVEPFAVHPSEIQYVYLYDGSDSTRLAGGYNSTPSPYVHDTYAVHNGWVFYNSLGTSGGYQLFSRAPDGTIRPVSAEGPPADFEIPYGMQFPVRLGDNGEVLYGGYSDTGLFYAAPPYAVRTPVAPYGGAKPFGLTLYVALGRSLFEVPP
ncbi:MAG: hypothetical protein ACJ8J0_27780 [Longimicrobiaceae bacterium]